MEINVFIDRDFKAQLRVMWLRSLARQVLRTQGVSANSEISLVITGQEKIRELNREYRKIDKPTDVLSFPLMPEETGQPTPSFVTPPDETLHLGEVIISFPQAAIQAEERGHPVLQEIAILLIHGLLHLLGYDHETPTQRRRMTAREKELLRLTETKL